jgi:hypothetical protein
MDILVTVMNLLAEIMILLKLELLVQGRRTQFALEVSDQKQHCPLLSGETVPILKQLKLAMGWAAMAVVRRIQ